ncbi:hypothetical protein [Nonomuraea africana]|uniref:Tetratricopeptide repeat protein n=1 Tax=Nonomuraea africana TaxID=46171 RepID=A0ABR9KRH3_9ACTN|nr:hypothetical protein [Nonomuraea africana]MBE1564619.1 hypothetical protein [Nonomuraea africana]
MVPIEQARTELLYLRRGRRRAEARPHLRSALDIFLRLGATPWAERASSELRATGETPPAREQAPSCWRSSPRKSFRWYGWPPRA